MRQAVYLDHNATTPVRPEARAAVAAALAEAGNPSSVHGHGRRARRTVEDARDRVAALVGAMPSDVVFTSGGTEANALAIRGAGRARVLVSAVEHTSVLDNAGRAETVPVDGDGIVDTDALARLLAADATPALVCVMLANNETGVIQPIERVVETARRYGARVHCDAVQAVGKVAVDFAALGVDSLALSSHKLGGPMGVGALVVSGARIVQPMLLGGGQERRRRAGTENVPGIAGFGAAAASQDVAAFRRLGALRDHLEATARDSVPGARVFGDAAPRLTNTSCLAMPGIASETQVMALDLDGIAVSAGAACSSGKVRSSRVLAAMGVGAAAADCAIRVSLGWTTVARDIDRFIEAWTAVHARASSRMRLPATAA